MSSPTAPIPDTNQTLASLAQEALREKADANFLWQWIRRAVVELVQGKYAKTAEERALYTPNERAFMNGTLLERRVISSEFTWPMPSGADPLHSGEVGGALMAIFEQLGAGFTYMWGDGCHPNSEFRLGNRTGLIAVHGVPRDDGAYLLAITLFVDRTEEEKVS